MSNQTVRVYPTDRGKVQAMIYFDGKYSYGEGSTIGEALSTLGYYLMSQEPPPKENDIETLILLQREQEPHEIRSGR